MIHNKITLDNNRITVHFEFLSEEVRQGEAVRRHPPPPPPATTRHLLHTNRFVSTTFPFPMIQSIPEVKKFNVALFPIVYKDEVYSQCLMSSKSNPSTWLRSFDISCPHKIANLVYVFHCRMQYRGCLREPSDWSGHGASRKPTAGRGRGGTSLHMHFWRPSSLPQPRSRDDVVATSSRSGKSGRRIARCGSPRTNQQR